MLSPDERPRALAHVARLLRAEEHAQALAALDALARALPVHEDPTALLDYLLATALHRRVSARQRRESNLYLRDFDVPQLTLFDRLVEGLPLLALSAHAASARLLPVLRPAQEASVVSVGLGSGRTVRSLLDALSGAGKLPAKLTLAAIEPDGVLLERTLAELSAEARRRGVELATLGLASTVEALRPADWERLRELPRPLVIEAAFALHHVPTEQHRDRVLARLRGLEPALFVLTEPDVDHATEDLEARLAHARAHFGAIFRLLERLPLEDEERASLQVCFFGRELDDLFGTAEELRAERHERATQWLARAQRAGFRPRTPPEFGLRPTRGAAELSLRANEAALSLCIDEEPVVAVLSFEPVGEAPAQRPEFASTRAPRAERLDGHAWLTALAAVAMADGVIDPRERAFLGRHAELLGASLLEAFEASRSLAPLAALSTTDRTRRAILRDCVLLANVDGEYHPEERARIEQIAKLLGLSDADVREAEARALDASLPLGGESPDWLRDYWALATKSEAPEP